MSATPQKENWNSRLGVILAVAGSAVGLGNFLRFPGLAAEYGGGAFIIAYFTAFVLIGLPICWAEWALGRMGGRQGFHASPGILGVITRRPGFKILGVIGVMAPILIYMYYVLIEGWCLAYAVNYLFGDMHFVDEAGKPDMGAAGAFLGNMIGDNGGGNGSAFRLGLDGAFWYVVVVFVLNFVLIYRGLSKGIEWFCKLAMPLLILTALVIVFRVLTLGTPNPDILQNNVSNGLGFMWNPTKIMLQIQGEDGHWQNTEQLFDEARIAALQAEVSADPSRQIVTIGLGKQLLNADLWLAAAGQIFFSLSVGFGLIITYASYLKKDDDVVLSSLTAASANEVCEVAIGGMMSVPAGVAFFGTAGIMFAIGSSILMGFLVLPMVFTAMGGFGTLFGFLFFFLLFLAAVTSSLSMLQPGIAFLEETLGLNRQQSVALLGFITAVGTGVVFYFSEGTKAIDTLDFWIPNLMMIPLALTEIIIFAWVLGLDKSLAETHQGAAFRIPGIFRWMFKYVSPALLLIILGAWFLKSVLGIGGQVSSKVQLLLSGDLAAWLTIGLVFAVGAFFLWVSLQAKSYQAIDNHSES